MKYVEEIIIDKLSSQNSFFVFPSELVSDFWKRKAVSQDIRAVLSSRFLSWDKFKEKTFDLNMDYSPVNTHIRTLFSSSLLEQNKKSGNLFKGLINPEHSSGSTAFIKGLTSILTEIKSFKDDISLEKINLGSGVREDLDFLYNSYTNFLLERKLFEPSWVRPEITDIGSEYFLFFPELIEDYKEFEVDLENSPDIEIIPTINCDLKTLTHFGSSTLELKNLLVQIGSLIDSGIKVQDIAITLPDMEGWRTDLESEAILRSIPLDFRQGKTLSNYPGARLFKDLINCQKSGYSINSMKQILLNSSVPWKEKEKAGDLFNFGINHHCFKNYVLSGKKIDVWNNALVKSEETQLISFYRELKSSIEKIADGNNFSNLKKTVQIFVSKFLDTNLWPPEILGEFQFCLDTLNDLEDASIKTGDLNYGSACDLWLSAIDDKVYVKRSETVGVNVFPYRVSGGAYFLWHFIPGLSQSSSAVVKSRFKFLKDNQRELIPGLELDFTESFINIYNLSGKNTVFSYSSNSFSGPALPPSVFVMNNAVSDKIKTLDNIKDVYLSELGYWADKKPFPEKIFPIMKESFDYSIQSVFNPKKIDFTKEAINKTSIQKSILKNILNDNDELSISPSSLDLFTQCPYSFLFKKGFKIEEEIYKEIHIDHAVFGQVIHECFDHFFKFVDGEFSKQSIEEYKSGICRIVDKVFNRYLAKGDAFIPPVWNYCREFTLTKLIDFVDVEADQFPGFRLASSEKKYSYKIEDTNIELTGRIDRVSFKGDKTAIIDYKKNNRLKRADISSNDPSTFQIPFYIYLVEKSGIKVSSASYYNVTKVKYDHVYNPGTKKSWCSEEEIDLLIDLLEKSVDIMNNRIGSGDYSVHPEGCDSCSFRRICRTKYHVR